MRKIESETQKQRTVCSCKRGGESWEGLKKVKGLDKDIYASPLGMNKGAGIDSAKGRMGAKGEILGQW